MKKIFLVVALGVAGLMSANTNSEKNSTVKLLTQNNTINNPKSNTFTIKGKNKLYKVAIEHQWITITSSCGKVYYLDANHYPNTQSLMDHVMYFDEQKCG